MDIELTDYLDRDVSGEDFFFQEFLDLGLGRESPRGDYFKHLPDIFAFAEPTKSLKSSESFLISIVQVYKNIYLQMIT